MFYPYKEQEEEESLIDNYNQETRDDDVRTVVIDEETSESGDSGEQKEDQEGRSVRKEIDTEQTVSDGSKTEIGGRGAGGNRKQSNRGKKRRSKETIGKRATKVARKAKDITQRMFRKKETKEEWTAKQNWPGKNSIPNRSSIRKHTRASDTSEDDGSSSSNGYVERPKRSISFREPNKVYRYNSECPTRNVRMFASTDSRLPSPIPGQAQALYSPIGEKINSTDQHEDWEMRRNDTSSPIKHGRLMDNSVWSDEEDILGGKTNPSLFAAKEKRTTPRAPMAYGNLGNKTKRGLEADVSKKPLCTLADLSNASIRAIDERFRLYLVEETTQDYLNPGDPKFTNKDMARGNHIFLATDGSRDRVTKTTCFILLEMSAKRPQTLSVMIPQHVIEIRGWYLTPDQQCMVMDNNHGEVVQLSVEEQESMAEVIRHLDQPPNIAQKMGARMHKAPRTQALKNFTRGGDPIKGTYGIEARPVFIGASQPVPVYPEGLRNLVEVVLKDGNDPLRDAASYYHWFDIDQKHPFVLGIPYSIRGVYQRESKANPANPKWEIHSSKTNAVMILPPDAVPMLTNWEYDRRLVKCPEFQFRILEFTKTYTYAICPRTECNTYSSMETIYTNLKKTEYVMVCAGCGYRTDGKQINERGLLRMVTNFRMETKETEPGSLWLVRDKAMFQVHIAQMMSLLGKNFKGPWPDRYRHNTGLKARRTFLNLVENCLPIEGWGQYVVNDKEVTNNLQVLRIDSIRGKELKQPRPVVFVPRGIGKMTGSDDVRSMVAVYLRNNRDCGVTMEELEPRPYDYAADEGADPNLTHSFTTPDSNGYQRD